MKMHAGAVSLLALVLTSNLGYAQVGPGGPMLPAPSPLPMVYGESGSVETELQQMRRRMAQYEYEMRRLRQQIGPPPRPEHSGGPTDYFTGLKSSGSVGKEGGDSCFGAGTQGAVKIEEVAVQTKPTHKLRGRLFFDHVMHADPAALGINRQNETGFDTARIGIYGNIVENVKYMLEVEFEGTEVDFKTVYIEVTDLPHIGNFRAGHYYEPIAGLEEDSGSKYQMFMERSLAIPAFVPSRSYGYMIHDTDQDEDWFWSTGAFRHESDDSPTKHGSIFGDAGDWVWTSRVAWNPYYDEPSGGRYLVHLGMGYSYRTDASLIEFKTISELGNAAGFLATSVPGDRNYSLLVPEFLVIWGPWSVQSEFAYVDTGAVDFWSGYVEASYFLTGDHRGYNRQHKHLTTPKIIENFFRIASPDGIICGTGAWEAKVRWSHVNMRAGVGASRGVQTNYSAGLNWYLNPYTRVMFDYVYEEIALLSGAGGIAHNVGTRLQVHW